MKHAILIMFLLLTLMACNTVRQSHGADAHTGYEKQQVQRGTTQWFWNEQDSTVRYWSFHSDSLLWYHPDSGLLSNGGVLQYWQSDVTGQTYTQIKDTLSQIGQIHTETTQRKSSSLRREAGKWSWIVWLVGLTLTVLFVKKYLARH